MNQLKQYFLFLMLVIAADISAVECKHLVITTLNGTRSVYRLDQNPTVLFNNNSVIIHGDSITIEIPLNVADKITYESFDPSGISENTNNSGLRITDNEIELNGGNLGSEATAYIYGTNGQLYISHTIVPGRSQVVSLRNLPQGIYILKFNGQSYKFQKK